MDGTVGGVRSRGASATAVVLRRVAATGALVGVGLAALAAEIQPPDTSTLQAGARLEQKLVVILENADTESVEPRVTPLLVPEINAFLRFQGASQLPEGITEPTIRIGEGEMVSLDAIVDLDVIRQQRERSWLDPLRYLAGRLPVAATGRIRSGNGAAQVEVQSVEVAGVPVPASVLQELVRYFTRTGANPDGTRLDQSIPLPYGITELRLSPDQAVVVQ